MPHGHCYLWRSDILWLNVGSDVLIVLAYFTIPITLFYFVHRRRDVEFSWIILLFALFIVSCGASHILEIVTVWYPFYRIQGAVKLITSIVSVGTAVVLWPLMPRAINLPSHRDLEQKNSELQALNDRLRQVSESRLNQIVEAAPSGLLMANQDGQIVQCNAKIESLFGYQRAELLGQNIAILIPEKFRSSHLQHKIEFFTGSLNEEMGTRRNVIGLHKNGTETPIEVSLSPMQMDDGRFVLASVTDISEQKKFAMELLAAKDAAEAANNAKSAFLANMSHEIRTPLGAMLGFMDLVIDPNIQEAEKASFVGAIKRNGELLSNIINDILDLSKIEAGKMQIIKQESALTEILSDTRTLLELQAKEKGVGLFVHVDPGVPETIMTDVLRLRQILINVVGNSIKFTSKGSIDVRIASEHLPNGHDQLAIYVKDTGCGIAENQIAKLFAPFSQGDSKSNRKYGGTGLGLILSKRFAKLLGGDVVLAESIIDKGSTFKITIEQSPISTVHGELTNKLENTRLAGELPELKGIKVLLADDSPDNQTVISRFLTLAGASVDVADNGREAIKMIHLNHYNIVLMDLQMPIMDGYEAIAELRKAGYSGKVVALTAHTLSDEREKCLQSGFDDHIGKPVNRGILIERVNRLAR
jgi:PAS domain S-box-containing protein